MKLPFALLLLVSTTSAFQSRPTTTWRIATTSLPSSQTENYLDGLVTEWDTLITQVKKFDNKEPMDQSTGKELTKEFLKNAINRARKQEEIEEEHLLQAHREFEEALQEEYQLKMTLPLQADDFKFWMEPFRVATRLHEDGTLLDKPVYRYSTTDKDPVDAYVDMPRPLKLAEGYPEALESIHEKEVHALREEAAAKKTLEELKKNEEALLQTLKGLEKLHREQQKTVDNLKKAPDERMERNNLLNELA